MTETIIVKCQSCIERQIVPIEDHVGFYKGMPICEKCLGAILSNQENVQADLIKVEGDANSLENRKVLAMKLLDEFEKVFDGFPLTAEEVLSERDLFYNHRAPALINCSTEEIKSMINRRKAVLFAIRIKDEQWSTIIEQLKNEARKNAGLTGIAKSIKEKAKKPSDFKEAEAKKLAKMLGVSVARIKEMGEEARKTEFAGILQGNPVTKVPTRAVEPNSTRVHLIKIQENLKGVAPPGNEINPATGRPYKPKV